MNTINDRIEILVNEKFDGNKAAFEKAMDMAKGSISSYLGKQRRSKPNIDMITKIITRLDVDPRWLLIGEETPKQEHYEQHGDRAVMAKTVHHLEVDQRNFNEEKTVEDNISVTEEIVLPQDCPDETRHYIHHLQMQVVMLNRLIAEKDERITELKERIKELKQQ